MKSISIRQLAALVGLCASVVGVSGCGSNETANAEGKTAQSAPVTSDSSQAKANQPVRVSLTQAQYDVAAIRLGQPTPRTLSTTLKVNGVIDVPAQNMVSVSVPFGGYIRRIQLEPGMRVRKGQPLVVLENPDYIQVQQDYLDTKAKLDYADLEYARQQELSRDNINALKVFQQTRSNRQSLQAQLAGLAQRLAILRINPANLTPSNLTRTLTVHAPVSGFITNVPVNNGRFVNPADVLAEITNVDHLHVRLNIFEKDISRIRTGQVVRFGMGGDATLAHRGNIFLIGKSIAADRTVSVLAHPDGYASDMIPGGYVTAQVDVKTQPLTALPEAAVVGYQGQSLMYVLERKQAKPATYQFRQIPIRTGVREGGYVAVTLPPDLDPQQTPIIVNGAYSLLSKLNNSEEE
ncbi:efflux transporter, RND family, MFP subunit (plasmid) [Fibrella aestuarina BUZ 2]|uniref:Efflux transporter, RND family, MFP subunit n=1 Tax=Fibrella aestuarina BUZ 2 TaxID=1166018 RepID=I0KHN8_9BACT|nr:efflux RND transporter periplasmic adaptor subunit [Fibrella aestuarina]CCH03641.1 efflux transporter, RND family, MFP subunit [Fibrella aestuarina BUZ 2]